MAYTRDTAKIQNVNDEKKSLRVVQASAVYFMVGKFPLRTLKILKIFLRVCHQIDLSPSSILQCMSKPVILCFES